MGELIDPFYGHDAQSPSAEQPSEPATSLPNYGVDATEERGLIALNLHELRETAVQRYVAEKLAADQFNRREISKNDFLLAIAARLRVESLCSRFTDLQRQEIAAEAQALYEKQIRR